MAPHRRRSQWQQLVQAHRDSGLTQTEFARRHSIEVASLRRWRAEFAAGTAHSLGFVEVSLPAATPPLAMTLQVGDASLQLCGEPDPRWLAALLRALQVPPC